MTVWVARKIIIMKIESTPLYPSWEWLIWWFMEGVSVGSCLWWQRQVGKRGWLAICFKHLRCLLTALGSIIVWELFLCSWTNRTHLYSLTRNKRCSCQQQKNARIGCLASSQLQPRELFTPCLCRSTRETWPGVHPLSGAVLAFPTSHLLFPSCLPPSCMESMHWSTWARILHNSGSQMTYFLSKGTLVYNKNSFHLHGNLVYKGVSHRLPQFILILSYDLMR